MPRNFRREILQVPHLVALFGNDMLNKYSTSTDQIYEPPFSIASATVMDKMYKKLRFQYVGTNSFFCRITKASMGFILHSLIGLAVHGLQSLEDYLVMWITK